MIRTKINGFTLVETLLASVVAVIVGIALSTLLVNHTGTFYKETGLVNDGVGLNDTLKAIDDQIRQASNVIAQYPESGPPSFTTSNTQLVLKLPSYNGNGVINNTFDYVIVTRDATVLNVLKIITYGNASSLRKNSNKVITTFLDNLGFRYLDASGTQVTPTNAKQVQTDITVKSSQGSVSSQRTASSKTILRNN